MKPHFFAPFILWQSITSHAGTVLVAPPQTPVSEYQAALLVNTKTLTPIDHFLKSTPKLDSMDRLLKLFNQAEESLTLSQSEEEVITAYLELLKLENKDDWDQEQRRLFFTAYLRLLQLDSSEESRRKNHWINSALNYMDDFEPPSELIPPPVLRDLESKANLATPQSYTLKDIAGEAFPFVLINGKKISTKIQLHTKTPHLQKRWTFISQFYQPVTWIGSVTELSNLKLSPTPYITNPCPTKSDKVTFVSPTKTEVYTPMQCLRGLAKTETDKEIKLPLPSQTNSSKWKIKKSTWIWVGVGAIATALIASNLNKKSSNDQRPTESYGF